MDGSPYRIELLQLFLSTQCSWCQKFYTQPFTCPYGRLQSNCLSFSEIPEQERMRLTQVETWRWRMTEMVRQVQNQGVMSKCRDGKCGALNPNPQKLICWKCQQGTICCPRCGLVLRYDIEERSWKCTKAGCRTAYSDFHTLPTVSPTSFSGVASGATEMPKPPEPPIFRHPAA